MPHTSDLNFSIGNIMIIVCWVKGQCYVPHTAACCYDPSIWQIADFVVETGDWSTQELPGFTQINPSELILPQWKWNYSYKNPEEPGTKNLLIAYSVAVERDLLCAVIEMEQGLTQGEEGHPGMPVDPGPSQPNVTRRPSHSLTPPRQSPQPPEVRFWEILSLLTFSYFHLAQTTQIC